MLTLFRLDASSNTTRDHATTSQTPWSNTVATYCSTKACAAHSHRWSGSVQDALAVLEILNIVLWTTFHRPSPLRPCAQHRTLHKPFNFAPLTSWTPLFIFYDAAWPVAGSSDL